MKEEINLYTTDGSFVSMVTVLRFSPRYEILIWGVRSFLRDPSDGKYKESPAYIVVTQPYG